MPAIVAPPEIPVCGSSTGVSLQSLLSFERCSLPGTGQYAQSGLFFGRCSFPGIGHFSAQSARFFECFLLSKSFSLIVTILLVERSQTLMLPGAQSLLTVTSAVSCLLPFSVLAVAVLVILFCPHTSALLAATVAVNLTYTAPPGAYEPTLIPLVVRVFSVTLLH